MKRLITVLLASITVLALTSCYTTMIPAEDGTHLPDVKEDKVITHTENPLHEQAPVHNPNQEPEVQQDLREVALRLALDRAGVERENAYDIEIEKDIDLGVAYWEVDFKSGDYEYDVKIEADTMEIFMFNKEIDD